MKKYLVALILLSLFASWPFFKDGFFESHDGEWMVIRFSAFHQTLASGQFPVRFVDRLNNNYGYPVLNFLYPLPFYLSEIPKLIGFSFVDSIKITFVLSNIISVLAMFWALSQIYNKKSSFTGAVLYQFIPYRFVDLYVRGSLGESLAFAIIPFIAGSIFKISKGEKKFVPILSFFIFMLILSHNVIAALFIPFFYLTALILKIKNIKVITMTFFIGVLSSSFFSLPALYDLKFVRLSQIHVSEISDHLVNIKTLLIPGWGYSPNPNDINGISTQIGIVPIVIIVSAALMFFTSKKKNYFIMFQILIVLIAFFLMTKQSLIFWQTVPYVDVIQFPWRLLSLVVFISAFLASYIIHLSKNRNLLAAIIIISCISSTILYIKPEIFVNRAEGYYSTNEGTTTVRDEYLPLWVKEKAPERANQKIIIENNGKIIHSEIKPTNYKADIKLTKESIVTVNSVYFPGWIVKVDGENTPISYNNKFGLIKFNLPEGEHKVIIKYSKSPLHLATEIISLAGLLIVGVYFFILWRKQIF